MEKRASKDYGGLALMPFIVFLALYVGCGIVFTALKVKNPFGKMPRYTFSFWRECLPVQSKRSEGIPQWSIWASR